MLGCSKNRVHIIDMTPYLFQSPNLDELTRYNIVQISMNINIKTIGKNIVRNTLNISFDGIIHLTCASSIKQSNDKNASDDDPIVSIDPNMLNKLDGKFMLKEYAAATSWR